VIRSMTGFGHASDQVDGVHYAVELRSLNNRFFKATFRLPDPLLSLDAELETRLRKQIHRGSLTLVAKMSETESAAARRVNERALSFYLEHAERLARQGGRFSPVATARRADQSGRRGADGSDASDLQPTD